jgi:hypothetical protein
MTRTDLATYEPQSLSRTLRPETRFPSNPAAVSRFDRPGRGVTSCLRLGRHDRVRVLARLRRTDLYRCVRRQSEAIPGLSPRIPRGIRLPGIPPEGGGSEGGRWKNKAATADSDWES